MQIIWTRSREKWQFDRKFFEAEQVHHLPLVDQQALPFSWPVMTEKSLILITSSFAADLFLQSWSGKLSIPPVVTFSSSVAAKLNQFNITFHEANGVEELIADHVSAWLKTKTEIIFFGAQIPAFSIVETLERQGVSAQHLVAYKSCSQTSLNAKDYKLLCRPQIVALASPSAVRSLAEIISSNNISTSHHYVCIGETTGKSCRDHLGIYRRAQSSSVSGLAETCKAWLAEFS